MKRFYQLFLTISRFLFVVLVITGAFIFAMFQGGVVSWTIFYALFPFALYSLLLFFYPLKSFSAERIVNKTSIQQGNRIKIDVVLTRKIPFPLLYTVIRDEWRSGESLENRRRKQKLLLVGWKRTVRWMYEIDDLTRGEYGASQLTVKVIDFFGWIQKEQTIAAHHTFLVYPRIEKIHNISLGARHKGEATGSLLRLLKDPNVITGVRNYEEGDRMSWIHWKSFARTETLMTKEFDDVGAEVLQLVFDNRNSPHFESQVIYAASLLQEAENERLSIQFLPIHQTAPFVSGQASVQFQKNLHYLAKVQPVKIDEIVPSSSFEKVLNRDGTIIVVTGKFDNHLRKIIERYVVNRRIVICFFVIGKDALLANSIREEINEAKAKGVQVHMLRSDEFADSFKEVMQN